MPVGALLSVWHACFRTLWRGGLCAARRRVAAFPTVHASDERWLCTAWRRCAMLYPRAACRDMESGLSVRLPAHIYLERCQPLRDAMRACTSAREVLHETFTVCQHLTRLLQARILPAPRCAAPGCLASGADV